MFDLRKAREKLERAGLRQPLLDVCLQFTGALEKINPEEGRFLTLSFFLSKLDDNTHPRLALSALSYMCTMDCAPLSAHAYIHDEDDGVVVLDDDDYLQVVTTGELVHPRTGEMVPSARDQVHLFYSLLEHQCDRQGR